MKAFWALLLMGVLFVGFQTAAVAEGQADESLKSNYSYLPDAPDLNQDAVTMLMMQQPTQSASQEETSKVTLPRQCMTVNKTSVTCLH